MKAARRQGRRRPSSGARARPVPHRWTGLGAARPRLSLVATRLRRPATFAGTCARILSSCGGAHISVPLRPASKLLQPRGRRARPRTGNVALDQHEQLPSSRSMVRTNSSPSRRAPSASPPRAGMRWSTGSLRGESWHEPTLGCVRSCDQARPTGPFRSREVYRSSGGAARPGRRVGLSP